MVNKKDLYDSKGHLILVKLQHFLQENLTLIMFCFWSLPKIALIIFDSDLGTIS